MHARDWRIVGLVGACLTVAFLGGLQNPEALGQGPPKLESDVRNVGLVLDCSGSMLDKLPDGKIKMDVAKEVVTDFIQKIPNGRKLTFIVYGLDPKRKCEDIDVVVPLTEVTDELKTRLTKFIAAIVPLGQTPLAKSMEIAGAELAKGEPQMSQLVVITDGIESCKGDPGKVADDLAGTLNLYDKQTVLIGLGLEKKEEVILLELVRPSVQVVTCDGRNAIKVELERVQTRPARREKLKTEVQQEIEGRLKGAKARPGPLEIALAWSNKNDLDLHVRPPSKEEIFFGHRKSACGGELDVDMNVNFKGATMKPVEHVVWSKKAPAGYYEVWVHHYRKHNPKAEDCRDPTPYVLSVKSKGETRYFSGSITNAGIDKSKQRVAAFKIDKGGKISFVALKKGPKKGPATKGSTPSSGAGLSRGLLPDGDRLTLSATVLDSDRRSCGCLPQFRKDEVVVRLEE